MRRAGCLVAAIGIAVAVIAVSSYLRQDYRARFARVAGELIAVRDSTGVRYDEEGNLVTDVTLVSDTGLEVLLRVRAPERSPGIRRPAALLVGGFQSGRRTVEVPSESGELVLASVEYPYEGPRRGLSGWGWARRVPALRSAAMETPPALLLAAQYLYTREDVDPRRVSVVGVSLGVPFAVAAAATDRRIGGAVLLHGGGDVGTLFSTAVSDDVPAWLAPLVRSLVTGATSPLEPTKYVGAIAPRPILMVNATGDDMVPRESAEALYEAAREPKRIVWLETVHVGTNQREIVDELMGLILEWMEARNLH